MAVELAHVFLVLLALQNSSYALLRRYSRGVVKETYSASSVLCVSELLKFVVSALLLEAPNKKTHAAGQRYASLFEDRIGAVSGVLQTSAPMIVPAVAYLLMNMISFVALQHIDATVFTMVTQLKILTTALSSRFILNRRLSWSQWRSLFLLVLGVAIITRQRGQAEHNSSVEQSARDGLSYAFGVGLMLVETTLSGMTNAYFERYLKMEEVSAWGRNLQLSFWSILLYLFVQISQSARGETDDSMSSSFFAGWSFLTCLLVFLGSSGGLLVAFATKHADAIMKAVAASVGLLLTVGFESVLLDVPCDSVVVMASLVAIIAMESYRDASAKPTHQDSSQSMHPLSCHGVHSHLVR